jgi:hypothetical protein
MVSFRYISVNTLHKGDGDEDDDNRRYFAVERHITNKTTNVQYVQIRLKSWFEMPHASRRKLS